MIVAVTEILHVLLSVHVKAAACMDNADATAHGLGSPRQLEASATHLTHAAHEL